MYRTRSSIWLFRSLVFASLCFVISSCGYTLNHRLKGIFSHPKGIFVPVFDNFTYETGVEIVFTNALIRELISRREFVVRDRERAGLILSGRVNTITYAQNALTAPGFKGLQPYRRLPTEYAVEVELDLRLEDKDTGEVLWAKGFSGFRRVDAPLNRTFDVEAPSTLGLFSQSLIESSYESIARLIMQDVYDEIVATF